MAGSYNHCVDDNGQLLSSERMVWPGAMIENLGDAYEAIEEMYGMIWYLAELAYSDVPNAPEDIRGEMIAEAVEGARQNYDMGLKVAKQFAQPKRQ
jgi:hypothetical protein